MFECCQGVCKLPVLGLQPGFDPFVSGFFARAGFFSCQIRDSSNSGFIIDLNADLECSGFDHNHWRTCLLALNLKHPFICMKVEKM